MHRRLRWFATCLTISGLSASPLGGQSIRHVSLNPSAGTIDRAYLPTDEAFDFLIRASGELREFRGEYRVAVDSPATPFEPWLRKEGAASSDATLRVGRLRPGITYFFTFVLVRRPTGNEARLIEARTAVLLRDAFDADPDQPFETIATGAAPLVAGALDSIIPGAAPAPGSPLSGEPGALLTLLRARGVDVVHADYRRQLGTVRELRSHFRSARDALSDEPLFQRTLDGIASAIGDRDYPELRSSLEACRQLQDRNAFPAPEESKFDAEQVAFLSSLASYATTAATCRALLRDVRLPRYARLAIRGTARAGDLLGPVGTALDGARTGTERLLSLTRKRDGSFGQVASDIRRGLDAGVTRSDSIRVSFATAQTFRSSPGTSIGLGLIGVHLPCSATGDCLRIVPDATLNFRLAGSLGAEVGFTLARTDAAGRTRHLFWFVSAVTGLSVRLGDRAQRLGAGAIILRRDEPGKTGGFRVGWYAGITILDLKL